MTSEQVAKVLSSPGKRKVCFQHGDKVSEKEIPFGEEVIAFNEKWIDEDFNPNGTRVGFIQDDGFVSATWNNEDDCYDTCYEEGDDYYKGVSGISGMDAYHKQFAKPNIQRIG